MESSYKTINYAMVGNEDKTLMEKRMAAEVAIRYLKSGAKVGLGTGSTVNVLLELIDERNLNLKGCTFVSTSDRTTERGKQIGLNIDQDYAGELDLSIDGADEIDTNGNLIKGGGGALTREKIVAYNSRNLIIIADSSKFVEILGGFSLPVEIFKLFSSRTRRRLESLGCECALRDNGNFITENGNLIADCHFKSIRDPATLERTIKMIPGVIEVGLFVRMANISIEGTEKGPIIHRYMDLNGL
ncbi:MAG: ribose-5-phosphate isomerase RpiA [Thermoplasmataceae archaeon]